MQKKLTIDSAGSLTKKEKTIYLQIHALVPFGPHNSNRDQFGYPKTATVGNTLRGRTSSQASKKAYKDYFREVLKNEELATSSRVLGKVINEMLIDKGVSKEDAEKHTLTIMQVFSPEKKPENKPEQEKKNKKKPEKKKDPFLSKQIVTITPREKELIKKLINRIVKTGEAPTKDELKLLDNGKAINTALWGRMVAHAPSFSIEAAMSVSHAISVNEIRIEEDYFTATDDLNKDIGIEGSSHLDTFKFTSGLYYKYITINKNLFIENLKGDKKKAEEILSMLPEIIACVHPKGKSTSFADAYSYAVYIMAEKGTKQPRSLSAAFLKPVTGDDIVSNAINILKETKEDFDRAYGKVDSIEMDTNTKSKNSIKDIAQFISK